MIAIIAMNDRFMVVIQNFYLHTCWLYNYYSGYRSTIE